MILRHSQSTPARTRRHLVADHPREVGRRCSSPISTSSRSLRDETRGLRLNERKRWKTLPQDVWFGDHPAPYRVMCSA